MKRFLAIILSFCFALCTLTGCQKQISPQTESDSVNNNFEEFSNKLFLEELSANTINLHYSVEDPAALGISNYKISLGDFSKKERDKSLTNLETTKQDLESFSYSSLSQEEQLTYDILMNYLDIQIALCEYDLYQEPLSFSGGVQMELPILFAEYEFNCEQDVKDYLKLIALTDEYFNQVMEFEAEKSSNGLFMSDIQCQMVIESCESFLNNTEEHYLVSTFENRLNALGLSQQKTASYMRQNQSILEKQLFPAYEDMIIGLKELMGTGVNENGLCYFEKGSEYYELLVYAATGCEDSMDVLFRRIESERLNNLIASSNLQSADEGLLEECLYLEWEMEQPSDALCSLQNSILESFPSPPDCSCEINFVDPTLQEYLAPAFYIVAPIDNYGENVIYINEAYVSSDIYAFTTLAHEGYPGHLYQTVMTYEYELPNVRSVLDYPGYVEGWATYVEMMSYEYAGLEEDVAAFLSHNQAATLSLYASSDIGIHYYGWTEEDMYAFWSGYGITNKDVINEITQLILSEPGNYLKYYVGYLEFLELKEYAKDLLDSSYSEIEFHRTILDIGPAPFSILEKYFENYYSSPQTSSTIDSQSSLENSES